MNRIAVFGSNGQLGRRLHEHWEGACIPLPRARVDLEEPGLIGKMLASLKPGAIVNAAAYTNVEAAEEDEAKAHRINAIAPRHMAEYAAKQNIPFLHVSTDYVFDGTKQAAYTERDRPNPLNIYGRTKLAGEYEVLKANPDAIILRVSWLYDAMGKNFLTTIASKARTEKELRVVFDQVGAPCYARDIARAMALLLGSLEKSPERGIFHMTNAGETSWHGFAEAAIEQMRQRESLPLERITPVPASEYKTKARRPQNSRLNNAHLASAFEITLPPWHDALIRAMKEWYAHS